MSGPGHDRAGSAPDGGSSPLRRIGLVLTGYVVVAWLVVGFARFLQRLLALPPLFGTLLVAMLAVGVPIAIAVAWRYPAVGPWGAPDAPEERRR